MIKEYMQELVRVQKIKEHMELLEKTIKEAIEEELLDNK